MAGITHEWNGTVLTITSDSGTSSCDLKGATGDTGIRGPQGIQGEKGETGIGEQGLKGDPFTYEDFTKEQLAALTGPEGPTGPQGERGQPFTYDMFTEAQLAALIGPQGEVGPQGEKGDTGAAFTYDMFTAEQLAALIGPKGEKGEKGDKGDKGDGAATRYTATLTASGWSAEAPYTQTITINGITENSNGIVDIDLSAATVDDYTTYQDAWACISRIAPITNGFTAYCYGAVPEVDMTVILLVV